MIKPGEGVLRDLVLFRRRGHDPVGAQRGEAPFRVPLFQGESPEYPVAFPGRVRQGGGQRSGIEIGIDIIDRQFRAGRHGVPGLHYRLGLARSGLLQEYYFFFKPGRRAAGKALQGGVYEAFQGVSLPVLSQGDENQLFRRLEGQAAQGMLEDGGAADAEHVFREVIAGFQEARAQPGHGYDVDQVSLHKPASPRGLRNPRRGEFFP